jgi:hypothetical protein
MNVTRRFATLYSILQHVRSNELENLAALLITNLLQQNPFTQPTIFPSGALFSARYNKWLSAS